jgi:peptidyl-prolyl cis-trans isomerase C
VVDNAGEKYQNRILSLLSEPLLHFFLLGLVVFSLHSLLNSEEKTGGGKDPLLVEITSADIDWLRSTWNKKMGREPVPGEMENLLKGFIREEILYREAVAMGLDQHDSVVRRRMAQKMDFLFKDLAEMAQPTEEELGSWFEDHPERYREPPLVSFTHVYFNADRRGEGVMEEAQRILTRINGEAVDPADAPDLGDRFMLQSYYPRQSTDMTAREFGRVFTEQLDSLEPGSWHGPVVSGYGLHLVYVHDRVESRLPELEEVRDEVLRDLMTERREKINTAAYGEIKSKYRILVEDMPYGEGSRAGEEK